MEVVAELINSVKLQDQEVQVVEELEEVKTALLIQQMLLLILEVEVQELDIHQIVDQMEDQEL